MLSNKLIYCDYGERLFGCVVIDPNELTGNTKKEYIDRHDYSYLVERIDGNGWKLEQAGDSLIYDILRKKYTIPKIKDSTFWFMYKYEKSYLVKKKVNKILENE